MTSYVKYNHRNLHLYKWDNLSKSPNVTPSIKMSIYIHSFSLKKITTLYLELQVSRNIYQTFFKKIYFKKLFVIFWFLKERHVLCRIFENHRMYYKEQIKITWILWENRWHAPSKRLRQVLEKLRSFQEAQYWEVRIIPRSVQKSRENC